MKWNITRVLYTEESALLAEDVEAELMTVTDNGDLVILTRDSTNRITPKLVIAAGFWLEARLVEEDDAG